MKQMHEQETRGLTMRYRGRSGPRAQQNDVTRPVVTQSTDNELPEVSGIGTDAEDPREAQVRGARTHDLDMCASRGPDDHTNQLDTTGTLLQEAIVLETIPQGFMCDQKIGTVHDKTVDEVKNNRNGTFDLETLRMDADLISANDGTHRLCDSAFCNTAAMIVRADKVVGISPQGGLLEREECPSRQKALDGTWMTSKRRQRHNRRTLGACGRQRVRWEFACFNSKADRSVRMEGKRHHRRAQR